MKDFEFPLKEELEKSEKDWEKFIQYLKENWEDLPLWYRLSFINM